GVLPPSWQSIPARFPDLPHPAPPRATPRPALFPEHVPLCPPSSPQLAPLRPPPVPPLRVSGGRWQMGEATSLVTRTPKMTDVTFSTIMSRRAAMRKRTFASVGALVLALAPGCFTPPRRDPGPGSPPPCQGPEGPTIRVKAPPQKIV